jgi:ABC-type branched-subunit amino acid transport system ATPase component
VKALNECTIEVHSGQVTGLVGPNGSGKTTLLDVISGLIRSSSGTMHLGGVPITRLPPHRRSRLGLSRAFQIPRTFTDLSCLDNLRVAYSAPSGAGAREAYGLEPHEALELIGLQEYADVPPTFLSFGQKRLLDLARALCNRPRLLLLDEPTAGVNPVVIEQIAHVLRIAKTRGLTILLVEHNMDFIRSLCDAVVVLVEGEVLTRGTPEEALKDERVLDAYFGQSLVSEGKSPGL